MVARYRGFGKAVGTPVIRKAIRQIRGEGLRARALRGSGLTMLQFGGGNILRLVSNLVLTRLLFPEAFGMMVLVQVFLGGLQMFSDIGIKTSIVQNKRGDDPDFLNTAWTLQIMRGVVLWLAACALAYPAAQLYGEDMLLQLLPVAGFNAVIAGFTTTNVATANRHLRLGRQTIIGLSCRAFGVFLTIVLAWYLQSVWALIYGTLISTAIRVMVFHRVLPGIRNRLRWDPASVREIFGFGQFIFLSTLAGFLINQGDRAILGGYITLAELGVYNVGYLFGSLPFIVSKSVANKVVLPLYRMRPPSESAKNRADIRRARRMAVGFAMAICVTLAFIGVPLVETLYDPRYALAGPMVALFGISMVPMVAFSSYDGALLAAGDSKRFFVLLFVTAVIQTALLFTGVIWLGLFGAIIAPGIAALIAYPLRVAYLRQYKANDPVSDALFLGLGFGLTGLACWLNWEAISTLIVSV